MDPLARLARTDKWFLGGGKGALYAPPFPKHLLAPGFWDECFLADIRIPRLFTALITDEGGRPIQFDRSVESWRPEALTVIHRAATGVVIRERRCVTEGNAWVSELELVTATQPVQLFLWSLPDVRPRGYGAPWQSLTDVSMTDDSARLRLETAWPAELEPDRTAVEDEHLASGGGTMLSPLPIYLELAASADRLSWIVNLSQRHDDAPLYELSVLPEKLRAGRLPGDLKPFTGPPPVEGLLHVVQQYTLEPGRPLTLACGSGFRPGSARASLEDALAPDPIGRSETAWRAYFASVPQFESSDPWLTNAYWYRWYGLRLNTVDLPDLPLLNPQSSTPETFSPFVTEGIGFFRNFVTYSAQAHLREVAWMHDPGLALGVLDNLAKAQRLDGSFPGHNYSCRPPRDFYHADFATGVRHLVALHATPMTPRHREALERYAEYFVRHRLFLTGGEFKEPQRAKFAVFDQNETGQEYMSRYAFANERADQWERFLVAGVDATTYMLELFAFLMESQVVVQKPGPPWAQSLEGWTWHETESGAVNPRLRNWGFWALFTAHGLLDMQNTHQFEPSDDGFFSDRLGERLSNYLVLPTWTGASGGTSPAHPATGLYPLMSRAFAEPARVGWDKDEVREADLRRRWMAFVAHRWLLNADEFWLPQGFPATAKSDPTYSPEAEWKDKRLNCPWNGRSWPMVNSHLVDALANVARTADPSLREKGGEALMKAIRLMFHDGDPTRPNSYEHYNPETGVPALYRGYDDYMHSWIVDLILRHAVGVRPGQDEIDPLPLDVDWIECRDIPHPKGRMHVHLQRGQPPSVEISP